MFCTNAGWDRAWAGGLVNDNLRFFKNHLSLLSVCLNRVVVAYKKNQLSLIRVSRGGKQIAKFLKAGYVCNLLN